MRIISGSHKGRKIRPPANLKARPTTDQAREGLFNILTNQFDFSLLNVADLFAGTGAVSYEFSSRGANQVFCIEKNAIHHQFIKQTIRELELSNIRLFRNDAFKAVKKLPTNTFDIVFADPPFDMPDKEKLIAQVIDTDLLKTDGFFILEHSDKEFFNRNAHYRETRRYGKVCFSFFKSD